MEPNEMNFAAMPQKAINVVTRPAEFFQGMPKTGGFPEPLVFAVVMGLIAGIIQAILGIIGLGPAGMHDSAMSSLSMIILMPIFAAVGSFIGGAILFVIWKLMGSQENYETAYRCGAYLMALVPITTIINAVPYVGIIISMAIYVYYLVAASVQVHQIPSQKAWLVFGIIGVILALLGVTSEYKARHMRPELEKWRQMGEQYREAAKDMEKSSDEMREQAEEMAAKFKEQAEEARKQAEQNQ